MQNRRLAFAEILRDVGPTNAFELERKVLFANRLSKLVPKHASRLYEIKIGHLRQLWRIDGYKPSLREKRYLSPEWVLCSFLLVRTRGMVHAPLFAVADVVERVA